MRGKISVTGGTNEKYLELNLFPEKERHPS